MIINNMLQLVNCIRTVLIQTRIRFCGCSERRVDGRRVVVSYRTDYCTTNCTITRMYPTARYHIILYEWCTHHFVENRWVVVLVLNGHFDGAHVVQMRFSVVRGSHRQVHFFFTRRFVPVEHLRITNSTKC